MMSRSLCSLVAVSCLALAGCEKEEKDSAGEGTGSASEGASEGGASEGGSDPTEGSTSAANSASGGEGGDSCEGDWTLGSVPFTGDPTLGQACDGAVPKNCADGTFIKFEDTGECVCIAECSSLGKAVGENCTEDGTWVCAAIEATNASMNSANACVNKNWNLCTKGGGASTGGGSSASASDSGSASASASDSGSASASDSDSSSCAPAGASCTFSDECCSGSCDFDVCA